MTIARIDEAVRGLTRVVRAIPNKNRTYEVIDYRATLVLRDRGGHTATYEKRERIRFLRDGITHLRDYTWGSGLQLLGHRVSPGRLIRSLRVGSRYESLIEVPRAFRRGQTTVISYRRTIRDGFTSPGDLWLEAEVYHRTERLTLRVVFPQGSSPRRAWLASGKIGASTPLRVVRATNASGAIVSYSVRDAVPGDRYTVGWESM